MIQLFRRRLKGVDKTFIYDEEHLNDYDTAEAIGRVRFGKLCFYYKDLGVKYFVDYSYIERAFIRISEVQPDDSPAYYYYRLILVHGDKEFANLIINEEEQADEALKKLSEINPEIKIGFTPPAPGEKVKPRFK